MKKIVRVSEKEKIPHLVVSVEIHERIKMLTDKMNETVDKAVEDNYKMNKVGARCLFIGLEELEKRYGIYIADEE